MEAPTPSQIARMARRAQARRLILTHFRIHMDAGGRNDAVRDDVHPQFEGSSSTAEDLQEYRLCQADMNADRSRSWAWCRFIMSLIIGGTASPGWCRQPHLVGTSPVATSARPYTMPCGTIRLAERPLLR